MAQELALTSYNFPLGLAILFEPRCQFLKKLIIEAWKISGLTIEPSAGNIEKREVVQQN